MSVERILTHDDLSLVVEHRELADARARLVIVHGYAEHRGRYLQLAEQLANHRLACHLFDLRGHGESDGPRGHINRFTDYLDDLDRVIDSVRRRGGTTPLLLLAHSLGGLIALCYVRAHPAAFEAFAVSSPFLGPAFAVPTARLMLARAASLATPALPFATGLHPDWVSRAPDVVAAYASDPRIFATTTPRWVTEVAAAQRDLLEHAHEITTPSLFLVAGSDRIADCRLAYALFEKLGTAEKRLHAYPDLYHEVFNELPEERAVVIGDLLSWIDERLSPAP